MATIGCKTLLEYGRSPQNPPQTPQFRHILQAKVKPFIPPFLPGVLKE